VCSSSFLSLSEKGDRRGKELTEVEKAHILVFKDVVLSAGAVPNKIKRHKCIVCRLFARFR